MESVRSLRIVCSVNNDMKKLLLITIFGLVLLLQLHRINTPVTLAVDLNNPCSIEIESIDTNSVFRFSNLNPEYTYRVALTDLNGGPNLVNFTFTDSSVLSYLIPPTITDGEYYIDLFGFIDPEEAETTLNPSGGDDACNFKNSTPFSLTRGNTPGVTPAPPSGVSECWAEGGTGLSPINGRPWYYENDLIELQGEIFGCGGKNIDLNYNNSTGNTAGNSPNSPQSIDVSSNSITILPIVSFREKGLWIINAYRFDKKIFDNDLTLKIINDTPEIILPGAPSGEQIPFKIESCPPNMEIRLNGQSLNQQLEDGDNGGDIRRIGNRSESTEIEGILPASLFRGEEDYFLEVTCNGRTASKDLRSLGESTREPLVCSSCAGPEFRDFRYYDQRRDVCCRLYNCEIPQELRVQIQNLAQYDSGLQDQVFSQLEQYMKLPERETCEQGDVCINGRGCNPEYPDPQEPPCAVRDPDTGVCLEIFVGNNNSPLIFATDPAGFVRTLLGFLLSISGMVATYLILRSAYQFMTSRGNPEAIQEAKDRLTSAIVGLLFIIFSLVIIQVIGVDILQIPGFGP